MFRKSMIVSILLSLILVSQAIAESKNSKNDQTEDAKWVNIDISLEGNYIKTTSSKWAYSPTLDIKTKNIGGFVFGIGGGYYGNTQIYSGTATSEFIQMQEITGSIAYKLENGFCLGINGSQRFGDDQYSGGGTGVNFSLPFSENVSLDGSFAFDRNKYRFNTTKITETIYNADSSLDVSLNDDFDWVLGANFVSTEFKPSAKPYNVYNGYTGLFVSLTDDLIINGEFKLGRDSAKYTIIGGQGGLTYCFNDNVSFNTLFLYSYYSAKSGRKNPLKAKSSFSDYTLTGALTFSF